VDGVTQEMVENAAKQANAHDFIMTFSEKYETVVGERYGTIPLLMLTSYSPIFTLGV